MKQHGILGLNKYLKINIWSPRPINTRGHYLRNVTFGMMDGYYDHKRLIVEKY